MKNEQNLEIKAEIQKFFKGEVEDSKEMLAKYSRDASIFIVEPKLVLFPKDSADVQALVKFVGDNKEKYPELSITARCAGTDMSGGAIGESLILDFTKYMNKLVSFEGQNITVQPGMFYRDFEKITLEQGLILPCYTASKSLNAMGGMFGNNSAGERTLKYGKTEDYVISAKVVFADGKEYTVDALSMEELTKKIQTGGYESKIYSSIENLIERNKIEIEEAKPQVHKNSAGYYIWNVISKGNKDSSAFALGDKGQGTHDASSPIVPSFNLNKLLVGSQGTLCIMTEVTFRLVKNPKYSKLVAIFMNDLAPLGKLVDEILIQNPETLETYDDKTMKLAVRFFPDFLKNRGLVGMVKFMFSFLPELGMMLTGGFPKLIILAEFAGENNAEAEKKCEALTSAIKHYGLKMHITSSESEANKYWDIRRDSFALLRKHVAGKHTAPFIDDIIVRPEFLPEFIPKLNEILSHYDITFTVAGHAGDGNFHIIPLMDFSRPDTVQIISELSDKVYALVLSYGGSITAEHNDGIIRTPYLPLMYGDNIMQIFKEIKNIFDPKSIFNPGKKVADVNGMGTKEYLYSHIALEHKAPHSS